MLIFPVVGCADVSAPANAWHKREGNVACVGCHHQNKTWHLTCERSHWNGVVGNCYAAGKNKAIKYFLMYAIFFIHQVSYN